MLVLILEGVDEFTAMAFINEAGAGDIKRRCFLQTIPARMITASPDKRDATHLAERMGYGAQLLPT